jgi:hypothetical protein
VALTISQKTRLSLDRYEASNLLSDAVKKSRMLWKERRRSLSSASRSKPVVCSESSYLPKNRTRFQYNHNVFNECLRENADPAALKATT